MEKLEKIPIEFISDFYNREKINEIIVVLNTLIERYNIDTQLKENSSGVRNLEVLSSELGKDKDN